MLPGRKYTAADAPSLLKKYGLMVAAFFLTGAFAALVVSALLPDMYRSEMLVQIVPQRVPDDYVRSTVTIRTEERLSALSQQVMSRTQLERLIHQFNLFPSELAKLPMEDVVGLMRVAIQVDPVRPSRNEAADAFVLRFTYPDAQLATAVTGQLGALFIDQNAVDRGALAEATSTFLQSQLEESRTRLEAQERRLEEFRERHSGRLPSQLEFNMQAIQSTQLQLQALVESLARDRDRKMLLERMYAEASAEPAPAPPTAPMATGAPVDPAAPATPQTPQQQLDAARSSLDRLLTRLTPEHPDIIRTKRLIEELERKVKADAAVTPAPGVPSVAESPQQLQRRERLREMRAELESLARQIAFKESEEKRLRDTVVDYQNRIAAVPGLESEWIALTRDYDTQKESYRQLLAKSENSRVAADLERKQIGEQFRILDPARVPIRPISPNRRKINGLGAALGLFLGLGVAVLLEFRSSSFRSEADVVELLNLPVLALVPLVETAADLRARRRRHLLSAAAMVAVVAAGGYVFWAMKLWRYVA